MSREYDFGNIEPKWQQFWEENGINRTSDEQQKPKYYVLDMFPYPSGAGLHVGHPLGYIASDIIARYKKLRGFNVLHPMGFDAFGLPAEQYAIDHGIHPAVSTKKNIETFKAQLKNIGFCYDWDREIRTCDPNYYKWTQWIFIQLYNSFYHQDKQKAESIEVLEKAFNAEGNVHYPSPQDEFLQFSAQEWQSFDASRKQEILMGYRLAYLSYADVWWCEKLGTVLANDEVVNGVSERGGHPVEKKKMRQWFLRITAYADRLLSGLDSVSFTEPMKEMQRNWIGRSHGCEVDFKIDGHDKSIRVYTTRPDTIFGADFIVLAPEHEWVTEITTPENQQEIQQYLTYVKSRSELERQSEIQKITGCFTGAYVVHPFTGKKLPVWTAEYVLNGYGTGAIMAVPCGDERDFAFARHFKIEITNILGDHFDGSEANSSKDVVIQNSDFISGLPVDEAKEMVIREIEIRNLGMRKVNYRLRDAGFSRQRYWGEPFPVIFESDGKIRILDEKELPLELPEMHQFGAGPNGQGPLANLETWTQLENGAIRETNTMPGYAGSSWYFLRYMDPKNDKAFCDRKFSDYWQQVDLYVGGSEHAVGHLLYSRLWTKILYDLGHIGFDEPFARLLNQGKISGDSRLAYRIHGTNTFVSYNLKDQYQTDEIHVDVNIVNGVVLNVDAFRQWRPELAEAEFILEDGQYLCGTRLEKMGKRYFNVVNPDDVVQQYGADSLRMYEMFLGPLEDNKPWNIQGIDGVHRFLKKLWKLFITSEGQSKLTDTPATADNLRTLHQIIRKISGDLDKFTFNTCISAFMISVNEFQAQNCTNRETLQSLLVLLAPFAPHIAEELWQISGNEGSIFQAAWPEFDEKYLQVQEKDYPISINGKTRAQITLPLSLTNPEIEKIVLENDQVMKWLDGKAPKKVIIVPGKIVNIVL